MAVLRELVQKEKKHFHKLSIPGQQLLKTIALYVLVNPVFSIFTTAFLWRQSHNIVHIIIFYICMYLMVPLGFYGNGYLLRTYPANTLSFVSLLARGLLISIIIFLPPLRLLEICFFGLAIGFVVGVFWANRNLLTLKTTSSATRIYFSGIESILTTSGEIVIPILIGWFIIFGSKSDMYTALTGYKLTAIVMLVIIGLYGAMMQSFTKVHVQTKQLFLTHVTRAWAHFRLLQLLLGFLQGVLAIIPVLMVMQLLGQEDTLGTVQSIAAIISALAVYKIAKTLGIKHRLLLLQLSIACVVIGSISFGFLFNGIGVIIFYAAQAISQPLWWIATSSLNYDLIDKDKNDKTHYAYISDQELYLNGGRIISLLIFLGLVLGISSGFALRFTPLIFAVAQIGMSFITTAIERHMRATN